jgi:catechol 2,3-dioxygenase-like lactoylglutathione lyase family enzyme
MLSDKDAIATVAVKNLETAKKFYEGTLGLTTVMENEEVLAFKTGESTLLVYRSQYAGTNKATAVTFVAEEADELVRTLRARGRHFRALRPAQDDPPGRRPRGRIHEDRVVQRSGWQYFQPGDASEHSRERNRHRFSPVKDVDLSRTDSNSVDDRAVEVRWIMATCFLSRSTKRSCGEDACKS